MPTFETRIEKVTVYTDRAQVTRSGKMALEAGQQELVVDDLPMTLGVESVRANLRATVPCRILSTDVTQTFHAEAPEQRVAELQAQIEALQEQDAAAVQKLEGIATRRTFLQSLAGSAGGELARGLALGRVSVEVGVTVGGFLAEQTTALDAETREVTAERKRISKELQAAQSRLQNLQRRQPTQRQRVTVLVQMEAAGEAQLDLVYQVQQAWWQPLYDLRLSEGEGARLEVTYQAQVRQTTGEAWEKVALTLSTAKPSLSSLVPELKPWYLHVPVAAPPAGGAMRLKRASFAELGVAMPAAAPAAAAPEDFEMAAEAPVFQAAEVETAQVEESGGTLTFNVSGGTDIPDDGSPHKVTLGFHEFPARVDYFVVPKLVSQAYRRARATNAGNATLLPGAAQVFFEGEFVGTTQLKTIAPGQECELFLGVDDRIQVERKLVTGSVDKKFMQDVRRLTYAYEIKITNLRDRTEKITVEDQVPVPRHEFVKIRRGEVQPAPARENDLGKLTWELLLPPGRTGTIRFAFTIESPRDLRLTGLPPLADE